MKTSENIVLVRENLTLIYSGLHSISSKGKKRLKNIAQSLIEIQNRSEISVSESIGQQIMGNSVLPK